MDNMRIDRYFAGFSYCFRSQMIFTPEKYLFLHSLLGTSPSASLRGMACRLLCGKPLQEKNQIRER